MASLFGASNANHYFDEQTPDKYDKQVNIVVGRNGVFHVRKTEVGIFKVKIGEMKKDHFVPELKDIEEGFTFLLPKIPFKIWLQGLTFSKAIYGRDASECSIILFFDREKQEYFWYCPEQHNTAAASEFGADRPAIEELAKTHLLVGEFHSHGSMSAFSSGTDDNNENLSLIYGVYGNVGTTRPSFHFRFACAGIYCNLDPWICFEKPTISLIAGEETREITMEEGFSGPYPIVQFPEEWLERVAKKAILSAPKYTHGGWGAGSFNNEAWAQVGFDTAGSPATIGASGHERAFAEVINTEKGSGTHGKKAQGSASLVGDETEDIVKMEARKLLDMLDDEDLGDFIYELALDGKGNIIQVALETAEQDIEISDADEAVGGSRSCLSTKCNYFEACDICPSNSPKAGMGCCECHESLKSNCENYKRVTDFFRLSRD